MHMWKNPELKRQFLCYLLLTVLLSAVGCFWGTPCALAMLVAGCLFTGMSWAFTYYRYARIAALGESIDRILHGQVQDLLLDHREGELAILSSQIQKLTVRLKEQADCLQKDKLRLTDAMADISHQLRTPLTSMNLTVSLLSAEGVTQQRRLELTRDLCKSLRRIDWLVEALLKIAKIDAGTVLFRAEPVSVAQLIRQAAEPLSIPMEVKEQTLLIKAQDESYTGDMAWSVEALSNVLKNCMEHTPLGGCIQVTATESPLFTEIMVKDSGPGFAPADIPHLFERFYRGADAGADRVGIGLALARTVIHAQNGAIRAQNAPEGGAMFVIRFYKGVI